MNTKKKYTPTVNEYLFTWQNYDLLCESASDLIGCYSRLGTNNPSHLENENWTRKMGEWIEYRNQLMDKEFKSVDEIEEEKERLGAEIRKLNKLERELIQINGLLSNRNFRFSKEQLEEEENKIKEWEAMTGKKYA